MFLTVPPSIESGPSKWVREPGASLRIPCKVSGLPDPEIIWLRDGNEVLK